MAYVEISNRTMGTMQFNEFLSAHFARFLTEESSSWNADEPSSNPRGCFLPFVLLIMWDDVVFSAGYRGVG